MIVKENAPQKTWRANKTYSYPITALGYALMYGENETWKQELIYSWGYETELELLRSIWWHAHDLKMWRCDILKLFRRDEVTLYEFRCLQKGVVNHYPHDRNCPFYSYDEEVNQ